MKRKRIKIYTNDGNSHVYLIKQEVYIEDGFLHVYTSGGVEVWINADDIKEIYIEDKQDYE